MRAVFKFLVPIVLLAASLAGAGYLRSTRPAVQPAPAIERVWTVRAELARFADHRPVLQLFGDLVAGREVTLRPLVAGEVIEASPALVEGGRVTKSERVLAIDPFHYRIALRELSAQRQEATARRTQLQSTLQTEWTCCAWTRASWSWRAAISCGASSCSAGRQDPRRRWTMRGWRSRSMRQRSSKGGRR